MGASGPKPSPDYVIPVLFCCVWWAF